MITIGLPVYNAERFLTYTLISILSQSYTEWNLIIINDGSTDSSDEIIQQYLPDIRIRYINSNKNKGLISRLNELVDLTETKYFFRMDADDIMHPDRLKIQLEFLEKNPHVDVLGTSAISIDEHNSIVGIKRKANNFCKKNVLLSNPFIHPSTAGKTLWFQRNKYEQKYFRAEDKELWLRTYSFSIFQNIDIPLLFYREGKIDLNNYLNTGKSLKLILADYKNEFPNRFNFLLNLIIVDLKNIIYRVAGLLDSQEHLAGLRSAPLPIAEKEEYEKILNTSLHLNIKD